MNKNTSDVVASQICSKMLFNTYTLSIIFLGYFYNISALSDPQPIQNHADLISFRGTENEEEQFIEASPKFTTENILQLLKEIKLEMADIKKRITAIEENNIGYKSQFGVHYKPSLIMDGSGDECNKIPKSCKEILENGHNASGLYQIQPKSAKKPFVVLCDMVTNGGGWTHLQKRYDGSQDFYLGWYEYKFGFGDLSGEFWIGLENIYKMTASETNELLIELTDRNGRTAHAHYKVFGIGPESEGYILKSLKNFSGDAGDSLVYHSGRKFTTKDLDQDLDINHNCANDAMGAWWYGNCAQSNLNGKYLNLEWANIYQNSGMNWKGFRGLETLAKTRMLIRNLSD